MFRTGIDNYGLFPRNLSPLGTLEWAHRHGAEGVAYSGLDDRTRAGFDCKQILELKERAASYDMYLEWGGGQHVPRDLATGEPRDIFMVNRVAAEEAKALGVNIIRSCSGGLMRWNPDSIPTAQLLEEMTEALNAQKQMLLDHQVILAIETHFEFTTFELIRVFEALGAKPGEWVGICLDTMNLLTLMEDPVMATRRILPWVVSTHIKDGGFRTSRVGFNSFTAPFGQGVIDFDAIFGMLATLPGDIHLNVEDHGGDFDIPLFDLRFRKELPDLSDGEMESLIRLTRRTREKMEEGTLQPLDRSQWPEVCEERMIFDLDEVKKKAKEERRKAKESDKR
jgi:sugar phosphate isomerase/epimerase